MYIDDNIQLPALTPNILIHEQPITIPEEQLDDDDKVIKKGQRYIKRCKEAVWNSWNNFFTYLNEAVILRRDKKWFINAVSNH